MEIHSLKQGWEIFALMETKQEFQVPFYKATIRLHLSLISPFPAALHITLWSCTAHSPAVPWPSSLLSPESSQCTALAQSPHQHPAWGFATAPGSFHIPQQAAPYHCHWTHQRCHTPPSTQTSLRAAHSISQILLKSCTGHRNGLEGHLHK